MRVEYHPVCELFPLIDGADFDQFCADIAEHGLLEPIITWQGQIIDGRNRHRACLKTKTEPRFVEWDGKGSLVEYVMSRNFHRRQMNAGQRAMVAVKALPLLEEEARKRQEASRAKPGEKVGNRRETKAPEILPGPRAGEAREQAAKAANVSGRTIQDAKKVTTKAVPEVRRAVESGEVSVSAAARIADLPPAEQFRALQQADEAVTESAMPIMTAKKIRWYKREREDWSKFADGQVSVRAWGVIISDAEKRV